MAYITRQYFKTLKENKLIEHGDWIKLHRMTKEAGLRNGKGYTPQQIGNIIVKGFTTTEDVITLIKSFYEPKADQIKSQNEAVKIMKQKLATV